MFNGAMIDVAIGLLLLFLVTSLMASAVVEAVGGFLHRRQKHLWDTLDLLLGNTSVGDDEHVSSVVNEIYQQPFITGLVRPNDRIVFDPKAESAKDAEAPRVDKAPLRGRPTAKTRARPHELRRRYYGPTHIAPREFANALLRYVRTGGTIDSLRRAFEEIQRLTASSSGAVAQDQLASALSELETAAEAFTTLDLRASIEAIRKAGDGLDATLLRGAVAEMERRLAALLTGKPADADYAALIAVLPTDLRSKLGEIVAEAGGQFDAVRHGVEDWFDRNMAAASEWYRRQTRWFLFAIGLVLTAGLNVDAAHAAATLYRDEGTRVAVVDIAEEVGEAACRVSATSGAETDLDCVRDALDGSIRLPVGWTDIDGDLTAWIVRVLGWIAVAAAVTAGAPFWFDLMRRALDVRRHQGGARK